MAVKTERKTIKIVKTTQKQKFKNRERKKQNGENHSVAKFKNREKNNKNVGSRSVAVDNFLDPCVTEVQRIVQKPGETTSTGKLPRRKVLNRSDPKR